MKVGQFVIFFIWGGRYGLVLEQITVPQSIASRSLDNKHIVVKIAFPNYFAAMENKLSAFNNIVF